MTQNYTNRCPDFNASKYFVYIYLLGDSFKLLLYKVKAKNFTFVGSILSKDKGSVAIFLSCIISRCENYSNIREMHKAYTMITDYQHYAVSLLRIRIDLLIDYAVFSHIISRL